MVLCSWHAVVLLRRPPVARRAAPSGAMQRQMGSGQHLGPVVGTLDAGVHGVPLLGKLHRHSRKHHTHPSLGRALLLARAASDGPTRPYCVSPEARTPPAQHAAPRPAAVHAAAATGGTVPRHSRAGRAQHRSLRARAARQGRARRRTLAGVRARPGRSGIREALTAKRLVNAGRSMARCRRDTGGFQTIVDRQISGEMCEE